MKPVQRIFLMKIHDSTAMFFEAGSELTGLFRDDDRLHGVRLYPNGNSFLASASLDELRPFDASEWSRLCSANWKKVETERAEERTKRMQVIRRIEKAEARQKEVEQQVRETSARLDKMEVPPKKVDALAKGDNPSALAPEPGERCPRCHSRKGTKPNRCALCNPPTTEAL